MHLNGWRSEVEGRAILHIIIVHAYCYMFSGASSSRFLAGRATLLPPLNPFPAPHVPPDFHPVFRGTFSRRIFTGNRVISSYAGQVAGRRSSGGLRGVGRGGEGRDARAGRVRWPGPRTHGTDDDVIVVVVVYSPCSVIERNIFAVVAAAAASAMPYVPPWRHLLCTVYYAVLLGFYFFFFSFHNSFFFPLVFLERGPFVFCTRRCIIIYHVCCVPNARKQPNDYVLYTRTK